MFLKVPFTAVQGLDSLRVQILPASPHYPVPNLLPHVQEFLMATSPLPESSFYLGLFCSCITE